MKLTFFSLSSMAALAMFAAVPMRWTVETSRLQPAAFDCYHGETLELEAAFKSYGNDIAIAGEAALYYQTNGMGAAWWSAPATVSSNRIAAAFTPAMDPGAAVLKCFLGGTASTYRAAFTLRFASSPGAAPNTLPLPTAKIDFSSVEVSNAPWLTAETDPHAAGIVSQIVDKAYVEGLGITSGEGGIAEETDPTVPAWAKAPAPPVTTNDVCNIVTNTVKTFTEWTPISDGEGNLFDVVFGNYYDFEGEFEYVGWSFYNSMIGCFPATNEERTDTNATRLVSVFGTETTRKIIHHNSLGLARLVDLPSTNGFAIASDLPPLTNGIPEAIAYVRSSMSTGISNLSEKAEQSLIYSSGVYQYMTGNTNAWFSGTNYITTAVGTTRTRFTWEDGMDAGTVPCSMSLWEIRDGKKVVWDQRDWTVWYWNFKSAQMSADIQGRIDAVSDAIETNCMKRGWAKYTAVRGLDNPDPSTLWIDTPKVQLMAGHQWEKIVEVGGAGYWTITGNGIELSQQDAESTFLTIKDFEGNACLTFRKTASYLVYCECGTDIVGNYVDGQGRVVFHLTTDVQPMAEFSTILDTSCFVEQDENGCPANYEWTGSAGSWDCHFSLKPGIVSNSCFARFKIMREGENVVEHTVPIKINDGIAFEQDGVTRKIRPTISGNTVNWVVVQ